MRRPVSSVTVRRHSQSCPPCPLDAVRPADVGVGANGGTALASVGVMRSAARVATARRGWLGVPLMLGVVCAVLLMHGTDHAAHEITHGSTAVESATAMSTTHAFQAGCCSDERLQGAALTNARSGPTTAGDAGWMLLSLCLAVLMGSVLLLLRASRAPHHLRRYGAALSAAHRPGWCARLQSPPPHLRLMRVSVIRC